VAIIARVKSRCVPRSGDNHQAKVCQGYGFDIKCSDVSSIAWDNISNSAVRQMYQSPDTNNGSAVPASNSSAILPGGTGEFPFNSSDGIDREAQMAAEQEGYF
jgi:hypothetical protein